MKIIFMCLLLILSGCRQKNTETHGKKILADFSTVLLDCSPPRINNIELCVKELWGTEIKPGEEFSFNGTVGQRTAEKGYQKAAILVGGKRAEGNGGGVCQVSSTLYNAAAGLGLQVTERHNHSADVHYIETGNDAAVCFGSEDLRFINTYEKPLFIWGQIINGSLYMFLSE